MTWVIVNIVLRVPLGPRDETTQRSNEITRFNPSSFLCFIFWQFDLILRGSQLTFILFCLKLGVRDTLILFIQHSLTELAVDLCTHITPLVTGLIFQLPIGTVSQPFHSVPVYAIMPLVLFLLCASPQFRFELFRDVPECDFISGIGLHCTVLQL